jgi:heptosyltransferase-2
MLSKPEKILIIQTASIGDVILSTGLAESLHLHYPDAIIHYLVRAGYEPLFTAHPFIDKVWTWDKRKGKYRSLFKLALQFRRQKYDLAINVQRYFSSGLITLLSGAVITSGFSKNPFGRFFTHAYPHRIEAVEGSPHEVERNHALLGFIEGIARARPALYPTPADFEKIKNYLDSPFFTISPASLWFTKQFPEEKWVGLIKSLPAGHRIYLLGSNTDKALCERIAVAAANKRAKNLAGQLSLLQSAALMKHARMNFTNDSAPMHLASAVNAAVAAIYCSTVPEFGFRPLSDVSHIIQYSGMLGCRPCGLHGHNTCPEKHFRCANEIAVSQLTALL